MLYAFIYWLMGVIIWPLMYHWQGRDFTLGDAMLLIFTAWFWPTIPVVWVWANCSDIMLWRANCTKSKDRSAE